MSRKTKLGAAAILVTAVIAAAAVYLGRFDFSLLTPDGPIGRQERDLLVLGAVLSAVVVLPVYFMLGLFAWKYREGNKKAKYDPHFDHNRRIELVWWGVPLLIITVLAVATWKGSHTLDPSRQLNSAVKPLNIQVVALQWKWLFIYPEQDIATVNYLQIPEQTPISFTITSDAPMNSFWIPKLGGQIYAMSGMSTRLSLMADKTGTYKGYSANISGGGFSGMTFTAKSTSRADFDQWLQQTHQSADNLSADEYKELAEPSKNNPVKYYSSAEPGLYEQVIAKFLDPYNPMANANYVPTAVIGHQH